MFERLGRWIHRRRVLVLVASLIGAVACGAIGLAVLPRLGSEGFNDPTSDSTVAARILKDDFGSPEADLVVALDFDSPVDDVGPSAIGTGVTETIAGLPGVLRVTSYWRAPTPSLASVDATGGLILVT